MTEHLEWLKEQILAGKQLSWDRELCARLKPKISILSRKHSVLFPARIIGGNEAGVVYCADGSVWRIKKKARRQVDAPEGEEVAMTPPRRIDQSEAYSEGNRRAAQVILEHPERYEGALLEWARMVMDKGSPCSTSK